MTMKLMKKNRKIRKTNGLIIKKEMFYVELSHMLDIVKLKKKLLDFR